MFPNAAYVFKEKMQCKLDEGCSDQLILGVNLKNGYFMIQAI